MNPFAYQDRQLYAENVRLADVADKVGTPCYVYSRAAIEERFRAFDSALAGRDHLVCYAVKANSNLAVLDLLADHANPGLDPLRGCAFLGVGRGRGEERPEDRETPG